MNSKNIILYTLPQCHDCNTVKNILKQKGVNFREYTLNAESLTELRFNGVFSMTAPILKISDKYYTQIKKILEVIYKL